MKKKGEGLSMSVVVIAIIVFLVLVILISIATGKLSLFSDDVVQAGKLACEEMSSPATSHQDAVDACGGAAKVVPIEKCNPRSVDPDVQTEEQFNGFIENNYNQGWFGCLKI